MMFRFALAPAIAVAFLFGGSLPVSAAVTTSTGGYGSTYVYCSQASGQMSVTIDMRPQRGLSRQSVAFRLYIQPLQGTGGWTAWQARTAPFYATAIMSMTRAQFTIYVEYAWFDGSRWTYKGEWIKTYTQGSTAPGGTGMWTAAFCAV